MKVAFLIEQFDPRRGGMETSAAELVTELAALGIGIEVVTHQASGQAFAAPVREVPRGGWGRAGRYRHFVDSAAGWLDRHPFDLVHAVTPCRKCDLYQPRSGVVAEALERAVAARRNWLGRGLRRLGGALDRKQRLLARLESQLLAEPGRPVVAALSRYMRRQLETHYALAPDQIRDVFNGVTVPLPEEGERRATRHRLRNELELGQTDPVAIFVGHNFRRKGLARVLEALARPATRGWKLLVIGRDRSAPHLRYSRRHSLEVRFLGSRPDVRQLYLAADVCVLPSYYDPCSRTVLEALSLGLPCITTRYDGASDCIEPGEHGFILESPEAIEDLAHALCQLADPNFRRRLSGNALGLRPWLSMRRHAEAIAAVYEEILHRRL